MKINMVQISFVRQTLLFFFVFLHSLSLSLSGSIVHVGAVAGFDSIVSFMVRFDRVQQF